MTKTKNRIGGRILALTIALLTIISLVLSLSACGETKTTYRGRLSAETKYDYVAYLLSANETYKLRFLAGYRGYDISPEVEGTNIQDITEETKPNTFVL